MRLLAIESAGRLGSLALLDAESVVAETSLPADLRSAQSLPAALPELFDHAGWHSSDIDLVAVSTGPGSFTGLRVGVTAAKCFAFAASAEVVETNTLHVIAAQAASASPGCEQIAAIWDAQRGELFAQSFRRADDENAIHAPVDDVRIVDPSDWLDRLPDGTLLAGPGIERLTDRPERFHYASSAANQPSAVTVGRLALHPDAIRLPPVALVPRYYRLSAAEEKRVSSP